MTRTTTTTTATLAVAADYADALMTARRAKNWLFLLLILILLIQLGVFFSVKFNVLHLNDTVAVNASSSSVQTSATDTAATQSSTTVTTATPKASTRVGEILRYVIPVLDFLGVILSVTLCVVLLLLAGIMLVGRLIGVSHVTSAFIWSVVLALMLFPWQAFLISGERYSTSPWMSPGEVPAAPDQPAFKIPGVLYTYPELSQDLDRMGPSMKTQEAVVKWARYAAFPIIALLLLLLLQGSSSRGLKFALGEAEMHVEVGNRAGEPVV